MSTSGCNSSRSHINPESRTSLRTSLLGSTVSCIEISPEGRSEEWSLRANAASRASDLTYHTSSSLAVHTSKMGMTASVPGGSRRSSAPLTSPPPVPSVISNLPPSYQTNAAIQKGLGDPRRRGSSAGVTRLLPIPPIPPIPTPPTSLPSRPSSIAPSRMTALPSYRESPSPRPDTRMSHEHPPLPPPPQYTESRRSMTQNSSQAPESTPDETTLPSPHTPSPREPDIARVSIQTRVSFQQHPFAMNAPVLFRASSTPSSIHAFPFVLQPPSPGVEGSSRHGSEGPERQRFHWTSRTCFLFGFVCPPLWIVGAVPVWANHIKPTLSRVKPTMHPEEQRITNNPMDDDDRWARRCLVAFTILCVVACLALLLAFELRRRKR